MTIVPLKNFQKIGYSRLVLQRTRMLPTNEGYWLDWLVGKQTRIGVSDGWRRSDWPGGYRILAREGFRGVRNSERS